MEEEAETFVAKCDKCQRYGNNMHRPPELLHLVFTPWPFMKWGKDIMASLPQAKGKKRLEESKGKWPEVLLGVLWAYRTTAKQSTGESPFSLVYGIKDLIPVKIRDPSTRYTQATEESNEEEMRVSLDLLEERREKALIRMAAQKQIIERYYTRKAHLRYFNIRDYVLKKVFQSTRVANAGKLSQNWEGPYKVRGIAGNNAYESENLDSGVRPREIFCSKPKISQASRGSDPLD
ncbi:uncharacterized protein LOC142163257 [Nicotiana tabacum]|uniref:Uncharacterized protein LOC142163257 n=1 Tax=Nicotiana tabacum TaxID=4097 RepID=A0AC58RV69_TOBAC